MTKYNTYTLKNGLRIIHLPSPSQVVYCGYQIAAGTRNESSGEEGIAHFCEHMTFKGTERRNAIQIINALEGVGGELNAFTNKEDTVFYAAISKEHFSQAVDILTDIVFHSQYPQHEIEKEVEVICDEIESYNDSPAELIYDDFENIIFEGHPLGHNILGNAEQLRIECRVENVEFATAAEISCGAVARSSSAGLLPEGRKNSKLYTLNSQLIVRQLSTHQSHVMLGTRAYDIHHPMRIPLYLLNNILGGPGMNARLNISLRERNGLVYTVESTMVSYSDTGIWCIYFGCDSHDIKRCLKLVRRELDKMMQKPLSASQLRNAKRQLKGQIAIACDNREQFALDFGKSFLHYGWEKDITHLYESIDKVTAEDIQKVANELFATNMLTTLIYK